VRARALGLAVDPAAYVPRELWPTLAGLAPRVEPRPFDWYTAVVHLVTAADGAAAAFGGTADERATALQIDRAVAEVQGAHPGYVRIDNSTSFEAKLQRAVEHVVARVEAAAA
jgi:hypothetical protein